jgi:hypothetical protein
MKGVSNFITYSITILLGFLILTSFSLLIYGYYDQVSKSNIEVSLKQVCIQTLTGIIDLYNKGKNSDVIPENSSSIVLSEIELNYPDKISNKNFEIELVMSPGIWNTISNLTDNEESVEVRKEISSGSKIIARTTQRPFVEYVYDIPNIPLYLQGKFRSGENDILRLIRYNYNGQIQETVILGESEIIVGINSIN